MGQLLSVDVLAAGSSTRLVDNIRVQEDYKLVAQWSARVDLISTDKFWNRGGAVRLEELKPQIVDSLNKVWFHSVIDKHTVHHSILLTFYTGHGVPPTAPELNSVAGAQASSPVPNVNYCTADSAENQSTVSMQLQAGDWCLHHAGYLGFDFMWYHFKTEIMLSECAVINKTLLIVSDCCFSGKWCEYLRDKIAAGEDTGLKGCQMVIQSSTGPDQFAHGGIFMPVWYELQNPSSREKWAAGFQGDFDSNEDKYAEYKMMQSPVFAATCEVDNNQMFVILKNCGTGKSDISVAIFTSADFFWYCATEYFEEKDILLMEDLKKGATVLTGEPKANAHAAMKDLVVVDMKLKKYRKCYFALLRVNRPGHPSIPCGTCPSVPCPLCSTLREVHIHYKELCVSGNSPSLVPHVGFNTVEKNNEALRPLDAVKPTAGDCWQTLCDAWGTQAEAHLATTTAVPYADPHHWKNDINKSSLFGSFKSVMPELQNSEQARRAVSENIAMACGVCDTA